MPRPKQVGWEQVNGASCFPRTCEGKVGGRVELRMDPKTGSDGRLALARPRERSFLKASWSWI